MFFGGKMEGVVESESDKVFKKKKITEMKFWNWGTVIGEELRVKPHHPIIKSQMSGLDNWLECPLECPWWDFQGTSHFVEAPCNTQGMMKFNASLLAWEYLWIPLETVTGERQILASLLRQVTMPQDLE